MGLNSALSHRHESVFCDVAAIAIAALLFGYSHIGLAQSSSPSIADYVTLLRNSQTTYGGTIDSAIRKVIEQSDKANPETQVNLGIALVRIKFYPGGVEVLTHAAKLAPNDVLAYSHLGFASYAMEDCGKALPAFNKAIELDPRHASAGYWHENAGRCYTHLKDYANAERHCASSASILPADPRGPICLGKAQFGSKKYGAATDNFLKAYSMTSDTLYKYESKNGVLASLVRQNKLSSAPDLLKQPSYLLSSGQKIETAAENAALVLERGERWRY